MSLALRRTYLKAKQNLFGPGKGNGCTRKTIIPLSRAFSDDKVEKDAEYCSSTILVENGFNVQELPVIVRRMRYLTKEVDDKPRNVSNSSEHQNYHLIQAEFKECIVLRDVFSLLSKCTKITPNIALGAMERINYLEKNPSPLDMGMNNINDAKDAIVDKLLKVVMKTEDTQTILNALNSVTSFIYPYKYKFCDEILLRVIDNKLTIDQLCEFMTFLVNNKNDTKYLQIIDKLWVGFIEREKEINEINILRIFTLLPNLQESRRTVLNLLEEKLSEIWSKIKPKEMLEILNFFMQEKYWSSQKFGVIGAWLTMNIQALDEDSLLEVLSKLTKHKYNDDQIEKAVDKFVKAKGTNIESPILIVGILNYCKQFKVRRPNILNGCCDNFLLKGDTVPHNFVQSIVYPYGYLSFDPVKSEQFWNAVEANVLKRLDKMTVEDVSSIVLSFLYVEKHPVKIVNKIFTAEYLAKINNNEHIMKKMQLIDTSMSLECKDYVGPLLPKDQWSKATAQDGRIKNLITKIKGTLVSIAGGEDRISINVVIPNLYSDETNLIDVIIHPAGSDSKTYNWSPKSGKDGNIALLIHLPEHYCSDGVRLVGPQEMRRRHLNILGLKVVSLRYTKLSKCFNETKKLEIYLKEQIDSDK